MNRRSSGAAHQTAFRSVDARPGLDVVAARSAPSFQRGPVKSGGSMVNGAATMSQGGTRRCSLALAMQVKHLEDQLDMEQRATRSPR